MELLLLPYFACDLEWHLCFQSRKGQRIFFFSKTSIHALGPSQPPGRRKKGGVELPACEVDHSSSFGFVIKNEWKYNSASVMYAFMPCTGTAVPLSSAFAWVFFVLGNTTDGSSQIKISVTCGSTTKCHWWKPNRYLSYLR